MEYEDLLCDRLQRSAMFNMSLSSKELFHSNFIYWISVISKDAFHKLISDIMGKPLCWGDNWTVKREFKNFDLSVIDDKGNIIFIMENKVKSIPLLSQLDDYKSKEPHVRDLLLLSMTNNFLDKEKIGENWKIFNYADLATALRGIRCFITWHYIPYVDDYIDFISDFSELVSIWESASNNKFLLEDNEALKQLRIYDIYEKCRFACYAQKLKDRLSKSGLLVGKRWAVKQTYSRSGGAILELSIYRNQKDKNDIESFVVQIQDNKYCHAIVLKSDGSIKNQQDNIQKILGNKSWCDFMNPDSVASGKFPAIFKSSSQKKAYCSYRTSKCDFIYEYQNIDKSMTEGEIFDAIEEDMYMIISILYRL